MFIDSLYASPSSAASCASPETGQCSWRSAPKTDPRAAFCSRRWSSTTQIAALVRSLILANVSVLLQQNVHHSSQATCSFYIGMYEAVDARFPLPPHTPSWDKEERGSDGDEEALREVFADFARSSLQPLYSSSDLDAAAAVVVGHFKIGSSSSSSRDSKSSHSNNQGAMSRLIWLEMDSRYSGLPPHGNMIRTPLRGVSARLAVEILALLVGEQWADAVDLLSI
jgi:hypothetical protein